MELKTFKVVTLLATALLTFMVWLAFLTAPYIGSAFLMITNSLGDQYPVLTGDVALPLLRVGTEKSCPQPINVGWAVAVWVLLLIGPMLAWVWSVRAERLVECVGRWVLSLVLFASVLGIVVIVCVAGMAVSLACM